MRRKGKKDEGIKELNVVTNPSFGYWNYDDNDGDDSELEQQEFAEYNDYDKVAEVGAEWWDRMSDAVKKNEWSKRCCL